MMTLHAFRKFLFQVAWYRIFARSSSGSNVKVRLNDYYFPGTGEEVSIKWQRSKFTDKKHRNFFLLIFRWIKIGFGSHS